MIKANLWKHQSYAVNRAVKTIQGAGYHYLLAGCGTGKTLASLAIAEALGAKRILVISTKASLGKHDTWQTHIREMTDYSYTVLDKGTRNNIQLLRKTDSKVYVINYESLWRITPSQWGKFDFIISDESHRLAGHSSKQSKFAAKLARSAPYRLAMTGTGFEDRVQQLYGQFRFLDCGMYMRCNLLGTYAEFFERYVDYYVYDGIQIPKGAKRQSELMAKIEPYTTILKSEDVLDLPDEIVIERPLTMPSKVRKHYREMVQDFVTEINDGYITADNVLVKSLRLQQIANGFITDAVTGDTTIIDDYKAKYALDILDEIGGEPTVIFTNFRADVTLLAKALSDEGITYSLLTGDVKQHGAWQAGDGGQVLIANYSAGSESVDLTRARYGIDYNPTYSNTTFTQSRYRMRRPGADSSKPITYFRPYVLDSIDEYIWTTILDDKIEARNYLMSKLAS